MKEFIFALDYDEEFATISVAAPGKPDKLLVAKLALDVMRSSADVRTAWTALCGAALQAIASEPDG